MFKRILVAVDKSDVSKAAYKRAIALAKLVGARLMVFHVLNEHEPGSPDLPPTTSLHYMHDLTDTLRENYRQAWSVFEQEYTDYLRWLVTEARGEGLTVEFAQEFGDPGRGICDFAREWKADLVITGSQGRVGLSELFLGSVSNHVTHHAPCSVLVVHQGDDASDAKNNAKSEDAAVAV
jgi:nucleotide-binding universal stress UspA family protein